MDRGPIRTSRSSGGGMINSRQDAPAYRPTEEPQSAPASKAVVEAEPVHHRSSTVHTVKEEKKPRRKKRLIVIIAAIIVVIGLAIGGFFMWQNAQNATTGINSSEYQAVFFTNGQV